MTNKMFGWHSGTLTCRNAIIKNDMTISGSLTFGDASVDTFIIKGRMATMTIGGSAIDCAATYTYSEGMEMRWARSAWGSTTSFDGAYFRSENQVASASSCGIRGVVAYAANNTSATSTLKNLFGLYAEALLKGAYSITVTEGYGIEGDLCIDARGANTVTISTQASALRASLGFDSGISAANLLKMHGIIIDSRDGRGGSTASTIGHAIYVLNRGEGVQTWTTGLYLNAACTTGISIVGATTIAVGVRGNANTAFDCQAGTFTTGLSLAGTLTNAVVIGACTNGISLNGTVTTGLYISGNATTAINISGGTVATGLSIGGSTKGMSVISTLAGTGNLDANTITVTDNTTAGAFCRGFAVGVTAAGAKTGSGEVDGIGIDMTYTGNTVYGYNISLYGAGSGNPVLDFISNVSIYQDNLGTGVSGYAAIDVGIALNDAPSNRYTYFRLRDHGSAIPVSVFKCEGAHCATNFISVINSDGVPDFIISAAVSSTQDKKIRVNIAGVPYYIPMYVA